MGNKETLPYLHVIQPLLTLGLLARTLLGLFAPPCSAAERVILVERNRDDTTLIYLLLLTGR